MMQWYKKVDDEILLQKIENIFFFLAGELNKHLKVIYFCNQVIFNFF